MVDGDGRIMNVPESGNDHALDAIRYGIQALESTFSPEPTREEMNRIWISRQKNRQNNAR